ncbi:ABC transporter ATP-binding protein [Pseudokineococcus sp. 1T1Z-3]|uniref:ABC transporter ATP-binding protein n=1 Tax=Pseudokineococcus sp. 1T1Z-3 TaxID=3132745 RepID=UPI0030A787AB
MIQVEHLTKRYGGQLSVDDVTFTCRPGTVTGFLGPNGAGKTTTMRVLCGLSRATSGSATVDGRAYADIPDPGRVVGVLLDAGATHPGRRGREVLSLAARTMRLPAERVDEVLALVGLAGRPERLRTRQYSLGMRQRLGLAVALLGDPRVLVLDEPANGLDPEGIFWMRGLLRDFADRGGTVLLSSHLLGEVEAIADQLVVIGRGRVAAAGSKEELLAASSGEAVLVRSLDDEALVAALQATGVGVTPSEEGLTVQAGAEAVGRAALAAGVVLTGLRPVGGRRLEELFFSMTQGSELGEDRPDAPDPHAAPATSAQEASR